jgi:hypothetical protein
VERPNGLIKRGGGAQALKVRFEEFLLEGRECFERANICNQSKLLPDNMLSVSFYTILLVVLGVIMLSFLLLCRVQLTTTI